MANDKKYIQSMITRVSRLNRVLVIIKDEYKAAKAGYITRNPDLSGSNLTAGEANQMNQLLEDLIDLVETDHAAIIATIESKYNQHPTHGEELLNE